MKRMVKNADTLEKFNGDGGQIVFDGQELAKLNDVPILLNHEVKAVGTGVNIDLEIYSMGNLWIVGKSGISTGYVSSLANNISSFNVIGTLSNPPKKGFRFQVHGDGGATATINIGSDGNISTYSLLTKGVTYNLIHQGYIVEIEPY